MTEPIYAVGYARLSDPKQLQGGGGDNQTEAIEHYISKNGLTLYKNKVYQEVFTGTTHDRPVFNSIIEEIKSNKGKIKFFIIKKLDRGSREGSGGYQEMKAALRMLGVQLRDTEGVIQPSHNRLEHRNVGYEWSDSSASHIAEIILAEMSAEDRKNILTRTVDTSISRIENGYKLRESNFGYQNLKILDNDGQYKFIQVPFEPEAIFMRMIFEDSASSVMTDKEIVEKINALGFRSRSRNIFNQERTKVIGKREGNKLTVKQMQKWRQNAIYCGINQEKWGKTKTRQIVTQTKYDGLVSIDLFNRANKGKIFIEITPERKVKILFNLKPEKIIKRRHKFRKDFLFKNVVLCPRCNKPFKAGSPTSKMGDSVPYYHCDRNHPYLGIPKTEFENNVYNFIEDIKFSDSHYEKLKKFLTIKFMSKISDMNSSHIEIDETIIKMRESLKEIYNSIKKAKSQVVLDDLENEYEDKLKEIQDVQEERRSLELTESDLAEFLSIAKKTIEHPSEILVNVHSFEHQIAVNKLFFEELPTYTDIVNRTPKLTLFFKVLSSENSDKSLDVNRIEPHLELLM